MLKGNNHYMIDLETLGTKNNSVITSIGVVEFNISTGKTNREFYETVDLQNSLDLGFEIDAGSLTWWLSQPDSTRLEINKKGSKKLKDILISLDNFFPTSSNSQGKRDPFYVWGNGASFDLGILGNAYLKCGLEIPWKFWNERDVRTIVALYPDIKANTKQNGDAHNALSDCKFQIDYLVKTLRFVNSYNG